MDARNVLRSREAQNHAALVSLWCQRRAGELLRASDLGRGRKSTTVVDFGITHHDSSRWQKVAAIPEDVFTAHAARTTDTTTPERLGS